MLTRSEHRASTAGGVAALAVIGLALAVPVMVLLSQGTGSGVSASQGAYIARITWFTLLQAGLSTLLSVGFAVPL
ncbi:MAG: thiamine/thiamine pyrophosphate ABC transporter permease ThiP, partial [Hoeflea sp.]|nr:thiamine/thiamine pyrophosphate ABC transporter permease ThiP [Hoeflea sp.]